MRMTIRREHNRSLPMKLTHSSPPVIQYYHIRLTLYELVQLHSALIQRADGRVRIDEKWRRIQHDLSTILREIENK